MFGMWDGKFAVVILAEVTTGWCNELWDINKTGTQQAGKTVKRKG